MDLQTRSAAPIQYLGDVRIDHHGGRNQFRGDEHDVCGGGPAVEGRSGLCVCWDSRAAAF